MIAAVVTFTFLLVRRSITAACAGPIRGTAASPGADARMQDTAAGFGQPIRHIFAPVYAHRNATCRRRRCQPVFRRSRFEDKLWYACCTCRSRVAAEFLSRQVGRLQQGRISVYLLYSFLTLIVLLLFVR